MCEILAPAGDKDSALAAINAGANAIYLGLKLYSARSSADNFEEESLCKIIEYAHKFNVKVYVAMNTLVKDSEVEDFIAAVLKVHNIGADAIIIADVFLGKYIKDNYPEITLHLSTQAGVCNAYGVQLAKEYGFSRVILARETAFEDICEISKIIETEAFIQGALCTCFSGQCYFSSFAGGNSGNRGKCKQPCRKKYSIDRKGFEELSYKLSLSDLSLGEDIFKLLEAGVFSFKIEGRMRRPEYVSAAVKYYRDLLDNNLFANDLSNLKRTYNRGNYTKGLGFGQDKSLISSAVQGHLGEFVGCIKVENGKYVCFTNQKFVSGDGFKVLRNGQEVGGASYAAAIKGGFTVSSKVKLKKADKLFITTDTTLNRELSGYKKLISLNISAKFFVGQAPEIIINGVSFYGSEALERAKSRALTAEDIRNCFNKTDIYPFEINFENIETDGVFIAASVLNALRRKCFDEYYSSLGVKENKQLEIRHLLPEISTQNNGKIAAICKDLRGISADIGILKADFGADYESLTHGFKGEKFIYLPPFLTGSELQIIKNSLNRFDGIYCDGIYGIKLAEEFKMPLFAGSGLNISNRVDVAECQSKYLLISKELTLREAKSLFTENSFYLTCGAVKVMDLIYCPFEKNCKSCDNRETYLLTDENSRQFILRRYKTSACRFEVFNCANLVSANDFSGKFIDCTLENNPEKLIKICKSEENLKKYFGDNYTRGHSVVPIK